MSDPDHVAKRSSIHASQVLADRVIIRRDPDESVAHIHGNLVDGIVFKTDTEIRQPSSRPGCQKGTRIFLLVELHGHIMELEKKVMR